MDGLYEPLQRALSCLTPAVLTGRRYHPSPTPHALFFDPSADPAPTGRPATHFLGVNHYYRLSSRRVSGSGTGWHVETIGYIYELYDRAATRIVAYHWHPPGSAVANPHLHVGRQYAHRGLPTDIRATADRLVRSHLPTGPIFLPTVLRLAIAEFGVEPLRRDWAAVLDESEANLRGSLTIRA